MRFLEPEINMLLEKEAKMWAQRSKIMWLKDGDRNTKFFHNKASQRQRHNYITKLHDQTSRWWTRHSQVNEIIFNFYQDLFKFANPNSLAEVLEVIPHVVTNYMNEKLIIDITIEEVETALKQMASLKSPGPDAMPPLFY